MFFIFQVKEVHQPAMSVIDYSSGGETTKITFFTGLHLIAPNEKFSTIADKVKYGALLKFGGYVDMTEKSLGTLFQQRRRDVAKDRPGSVADQDNDPSGVADLDGVVDKIEIAHYAEMGTMGSRSSPGFSIEFWIRPRRMPVDKTPMSLFFKYSPTSGSISLELNFDGSLTFVAHLNRETRITCITNVQDDTHKVKVLAFHHIAVTGTVGTSLRITVNGVNACHKTTSSGFKVLPASNEGTLVFGGSRLNTSPHKRFNGQMSNLQLFSKERTLQEISESIKEPDPKATGSIGFWSLRQSDEIDVVHYVISDSQKVSKLQVLEEYDPPLTGFPVETMARDRNIYIIRLTGKKQIVARKFTLSADKNTLTTASSRQTIITSSKANKACLAATLDPARDRLILVECFAESPSSADIRFQWNIFKFTKQGQITASTQDKGKGSLLVTDIGSLDTRLSAKVINNHLFLTAGTTSSASTLFLEIVLSSDGFPAVSVDKLRVETIGPEVADNGATFYAYLRKDSTSSLKPFLRRVRPKNGVASTSYAIEVKNINPASLVANKINSNMPDNDWFWYLFKISTFDGGIAILSGERISIQTPDNNPQNKEGWSYVKSNCETLQADRHRELLNFWVFKTKSCDPENGGYSVVSGEIGPKDCILLWPKTEHFEPSYYQHILAHPSEKIVRGAKARFGPWLGPWRLMIPTEATEPVRPLPLPADAPQNAPKSVYEGNKYSLLHYGNGISVKAPSSGSGVRGGLLNFAKTTVAPVIVSRDKEIKLIFRGNGGSFPLVAFPHDEKTKLKAIFSTVYQEGGYAQRRMTSGLFYSIAYTPPSDSSSPGKFKTLARIGGVESLEYPDPPTSFVWLIPPSFKVAGMCAAVSTLFHFSDDTVKSSAPNSVASLTKVVTQVVGPGSFGEGLFKPALTVHFDVTLLNKIGERVHETLMRKITDHIPQPPPAIPTKRPKSDTPSWQIIADYEACVSLSNLTFWEDKVQKQKLKDKLTEVLQSKWMAAEILEIRKSVAPDFLQDASARYSAYGGIAVLIASRLRSPEFLQELLTNEETYIKPILDSHLKILDFIRPDLGVSVREDIMSALMAKEISTKVCICRMDDVFYAF